MTAHIAFDNTFAREMDGFHVPWKGDQVPAATVVAYNDTLAHELGLEERPAAEVLAGSMSVAGSEPVAMAYAGHQFGGFSPQLGDGRALLIGEVIDRSGARRDIHLKGSGKTPFSRGGDGKAVLGPVLREFLMGEAMHALGIPTTRALAAVTTGETVLRHDGPMPGAVLTRVAASHLRVGTFQFFAARRDVDRLRQLADYAILRHDPKLSEEDDKYLKFFVKIRDRQADLLAQWMLVGFVHGVMNTDNMTISGETIDYGPCAFLDIYDPRAVFSSIDHQGRYAFGNQPPIAQWNLARLAEAMLPLIDDDSDRAVARVTAVLNGFPARYEATWLAKMRAKLGLSGDNPADLGLANELFEAMEGQAVDFTNLFRHLAQAAEGDWGPARDLFLEPESFDRWAGRWTERFAADERPAESRIADMRGVNPIYIPRNHKVEDALNAAIAGDFAPFETLLDLVKSPFTLRQDYDAFARPAPDAFGAYTTYCGT